MKIIKILKFPCSIPWKITLFSAPLPKRFKAILSALKLIQRSHFVEIDAFTLIERYFWSKFITTTYLYNFDPLKPHFYIVKLGFTGVYFIFLISAQNIDCEYSLEPPRRGGSNEYPQSMF